MLGSSVFFPCSPESDVLRTVTSSDPAPQFCAQWNPDFSHNGRKCCARPPIKGRKARNKCTPTRLKANYCSEMTADQIEYMKNATNGKLGDLLLLLTQEMGKWGDQAFCTVNNGFLAHGRPVVPTSLNRLLLRSPDRCLNFGTDAMVGMLEWVGHEVGKNYSANSSSGVHVVLGDIAAPRGGCLFGRSGRRGHASHTSGQDADIGFLTVKDGKESPVQFHYQFDPATNWWFIKRIFKNPFACIKVIFLDRRHIHSLKKFAKKDPEWGVYERFLRHMPGHKNHFHVRVGKGPGLPGCAPGAHPELEFEEDGDILDNDEISFIEELEQLKTRQSFSVQQ